MSVVAAILAAGRGSRFGGDKTALILRGRPVWRWSVDVYLSHPDVDRVLLVTSPDRAESFAVSSPVEVVAGGESRQESSRAALTAAGDAEILLVHDAARPFVTPDVVSRVVAAVREGEAAAAGLRVTDTVKRVRDGRVKTLDRNELFAMQTPQGARTDLLRRAHAEAEGEHTDEMALLEAIGVHPRIVDGDPRNFKITTPGDLERARLVAGAGEVRTGLGYDVHGFSDDPSRALWLGGVHFPDHPALDGHSDADVLLHAATDALLGAAAMGDIGVHFPNTDPQWRGAPSIEFLRYAAGLLRRDGWAIANLDMTLIAESPKVMRRADEIRAVVSAALEISADRVSIKATTNERLGSIGRGEGAAAFATATIRQV